jgi:hypothetical protein
MDFVDILLKFVIFVTFVVFAFSVWSIKSKKKKKSGPILIWVKPKNYRRIALYAIENCTNPTIWVDGTQIFNSSENGILVQKAIRQCIDFLIKDGDEEVLGFHDHPGQMWVSEKYKHIAKYCSEKGWLKIDKHSRYLLQKNDISNNS